MSFRDRLVAYGLNVKRRRATAPFNTVLPAITGTVQVGQLLSLSDGTWTGITPVFTYQWYADGAPIEAANGDEYTLTASEEGAVIRGSVTATSVAGSATAMSAPTGAVAAA